MRKSIQKSSVKVVIGCDCDQDRVDYGGTRYDERDCLLRWDGLRVTLETIQKISENVRIAYGMNVPFTLNIRVDDQVASSHGDPAWILKNMASELKDVERFGHEIAWHPHLWRWDKATNCWMQEEEDREWIWDRLHVWGEAFQEAWRLPRAVHGGWMFQNDTSMQALDHIGIQVEYSAIPGMKISGRPTRDGSRFWGACDWSISPPFAYYPLKADYRTGPDTPDKAITLNLLELPTFTFDSLMIRMLQAGSDMVRLRGCRRWLSLFDESKGTVFVNVASRPALFRRSFRAFIQNYLRGDGYPFFVAFFHADEVLPERCRSFRKHLYAGSYLESNIRFMIDSLQKAEIDLEFIKAQDSVLCTEMHGPVT